MAQQTREQLKSTWATGATMTESMFGDLFDSVFVKNSDTGTTGPQGYQGYLSTVASNESIEGLGTVGSPLYTTNVTPQSGASYTANNCDYVLINAANHVLTLPDPIINRRITAKVIASPVAVSVITNAAGIKIDGVDRSVTGLSLNNQYEVYTFTADGTDWWIS